MSLYEHESRVVQAGQTRAEIQPRLPEFFVAVYILYFDCFSNRFQTSLDFLTARF